MRKHTSIGRLTLVLFLVFSFVACSDDERTIVNRAVSDPSVAGPYPVGVTRIELFDAEQGRVELTEIWYPAAESARGQKPAAARSFLPEGLEAIADNATIPLIAVRDAELSPDAPFPLIAFSHGSGGVRYQNSPQCDHLASHGYIVVAPDHAGNTFFPSDIGPEGTNLVVARPLDIIFLLDEFSDFSSEPGHRFEGWVDTTMAMGIFGHSFGAFTTLAVASMDDRIAAAMPLALGGPVSDTYDAATLLMLGTEDKTIDLDGNQDVRDAFEDAPNPRYLVEVIDGGHYSFSFACDVNVPGAWDGDGCGDATRFADDSPFTFAPHRRVWDIMNTYGAALFGRYIKGIEEYDETLNTNIDAEIMTYIAEP